MGSSANKCAFVTFVINAFLPLSQAAPLVVDGTSITLGGDAVYDTVTVINGGTIFVDSATGWLNLEASTSITVDATSSIIGTARSFHQGGGGGGGSSGGTNSNSASNGGAGGPGSPGSGLGGGGGEGELHLQALVPVGQVVAVACPPE